MSGLQGLTGYEGCCCNPSCLQTFCGLDDIANNGSIRLLEMPPLFDIPVSFTLSVATPEHFGCVSLTPFDNTYYDWIRCYTSLRCCCDYQVLGECVAGGRCSKSFCQTEYGDYHIHPDNWNTQIEPGHQCKGSQSLVTSETNAIVGSNLAQHLWSGDFIYPSGCSDNLFSGNGCNNADYCTNPPWDFNYFPMECEAILNIDGSTSVPPNTNYASIAATLRVINIFAAPEPPGIPWYIISPTCDCKCPYMELTISVGGVIYYKITDVYNQPPNPVSYDTLPVSTTVLTYRKRLVRAKALNYYTYYDWINDTSEPFYLFMIQSFEDGVHLFCDRNAVDGTLATCTSVGCPNCVPTGGSSGTDPTEYLESYALCSNAKGETNYAPGISSASCVVYPNEIELSIAANYSPTITGISPPTGTTAGGTVVTITGTGLWGCHEVRVDGTLVPSFYVNTSSTTSFSFATPAHGAGLVQVLCKWSWGTTTTNFTYV